MAEKHDDDREEPDEEDEFPEVEQFFSEIYKLRSDVAQQFAAERAAAMKVDQATLKVTIEEAIGQAFFGLFSLLDGVSGPLDFPEIELVLVNRDNESLNGSPLHELYHELNNVAAKTEE